MALLLERKGEERKEGVEKGRWFYLFPKQMLVVKETLQSTTSRTKETSDTKGRVPAFLPSV